MDDDNTGTSNLPLAEIGAIVGIEHVQTDAAICKLYSHDLCICDDAVLADAIVRPASAQQVAALLRLARAHGLAIAPRGGGVSYTRGYVPERRGTLILDLLGMDAIHELNAADLYVTVGPGCTWQKVDAAAAAVGLRPVMKGPISGLHATVCGTASQGTGSAPMGSIIALEVVLADGRIVRTGSGAIQAHPAPFYRSYGPDFTGLFLGDTGAFGIKTRCTLALEPIPAGVAFASVSLPNLAATAALMTAIARSGIACRMLAMDPLKNRTATRVGIVEGLSTLGKVVGAAGSFTTGLRQAASIALAGEGVLADVPWSLHVTVEGHDQHAADYALAALRPLWKGTAKEVPPSVPTALRARPYSSRGVLGMQGERWVPVHGVFPLSVAAEAVRRTEAFLLQHAELLRVHGIEISFIVTSNAALWLLEPMFYWSDSAGPLQAHVLGSKYEKYRNFAPNPAARAVVLQLRSELAETFDAIGAVHSQIGKFYRFSAGLDPDTWAVLTEIKDTLDPSRLLNPGNFGWR